MSSKGSAQGIPLVELVASRVRQSTHGRIRNLVVEESQGRVVVSGQAPTRHTRQLALQGVLEVLSGEQVRENITVH